MVIRTYIKNEDLLPFLTGQPVENTINTESKNQQRLPPIIIRAFDGILGGILTDIGTLVDHDAPIEIFLIISDFGESDLMEHDTLKMERFQA